MLENRIRPMIQWYHFVNVVARKEKENGNKGNV